MTTSISANTFAVSDVEPAEKTLPEVSYHQAVREFLGSSIESCSKYHGRLVANVVSHPLIAAVHGAFAWHRPLCLSPDIIWLTVLQGLAIHVSQNAEQLRGRFVAHEGKLKITVRRDDFIKGSPENPWPEVFTAFSEQIRQYIGDSHRLIVANFSTTGPVERAASEIALLDVMQSYFSYELESLCGIPSINLEGTVDDWVSIVDRVRQFSEYGLDWWIAPLLPILDHFVNAARGSVDRKFWESIYKFHGPKGSGTPHVTGWISAFFPYVNTDCGFSRNATLRDFGQSRRLQKENFPRLPSKAPFKWRVGIPPSETVFDMEFIGGLIGVAQDPQTLCLRPEIGWIVREETKGRDTTSDECLNR